MKGDDVTLIPLGGDWDLDNYNNWEIWSNYQDVNLDKPIYVK